MAYDPEKHHRWSVRLQGYDYSRAGAYFVTVCTQGRACLFGDVVEGEMRLNDAGRIVQIMWDDLPSHYPGVETNEFVVMPNHVHGIIVLNPPSVGAQFIAPQFIAPQFIAPRFIAPQFIAPQFIAPPTGATPTGTTSPGPIVQGAMNRAPTLGDVVRGFKARATVAVNRLHKTSGIAIWQRNYYEHIIRNDESLNSIREYIINNPLQWELDREKLNSVGMGLKLAPTEDEPWRI